MPCQKLPPFRTRAPQTPSSPHGAALLALAHKHRSPRPNGADQPWFGQVRPLHSRPSCCSRLSALRNPIPLLLIRIPGATSVACRCSPLSPPVARAMLTRARAAFLLAEDMRTPTRFGGRPDASGSGSMRQGQASGSVRTPAGGKGSEGRFPRHYRGELATPSSQGHRRGTGRPRVSLRRQNGMQALPQR